MNNVKVVTLPLKVEELKEFIEKKDTLYVVSYKDTQIKGNVAYNYLSNLDLHAEFDFTDCDYELREEALTSFMQTRNLISSDGPRLNVAQILLEKRGIDTQDMFSNSMFSKDEIELFITNNQEILNKWEQFLESTIIYAQMCLRTEFDDENFKLENPYPDLEVIDDIHWLGTNIVTLFSIPTFMEQFLSITPIHPHVYFKQQFEEYMFKGSNLFSYYLAQENTPFLAFFAEFRGDLKIEDLFDFAQKVSNLELTEIRE